MNERRHVITAILLLYLTNYIPVVLNENQLWLWQCDSISKFCSRIPAQANTTSQILYPNIEVCRLTCGQYGPLWPQPTGTVKLGTTLLQFSARTINVSVNTNDSDTKNYMQEVIKVFTQTIKVEDTLSCPQRSNWVTIQITVNSANMRLNWNTDESYNLTAKTENKVNLVQIQAETVFGARHALETLSQLIDFYPNSDGSKCLVIVEEAQIVDKPAFPHRGLLIDSARNFQSVETLKKHLDGMAASKLNVLHWHITDSQSFPLELPSLPIVTKNGAYSADKIYHPADIKELLTYAKLRGIRIIIEIDAPAHAGNGWQWGPEEGLGNLVVCHNQQPWRSFCIQPPCGQFNPVNSNVYNVLKDLYGDIVNMLPKGEVFHMGGDEVYIPCWNSTPEIIKFIGNKPRTQETFLDLWSSYQEQALNAYDNVVGNSDTPIILWTSHLTEVDVIEKYLPKDRYIIQTWVPAADNLPNQLLALGYRIIVSTKDAWYLDHGVWGNTDYHNWQTVYNNQIPRNTKTLGGEVCMWGEYVDDNSVETRVWPRAAAAAARLWSDPKTNNQVPQRFFRHRERLVARGINAETLIPRWCYQNEGQC